MKRFVCLSLLCALFACKDGDSDGFQVVRRRGAIVQPSPLTLTAGVETFTSCEQVETYIESQMIADMDHAIDAQILRLKEPGGLENTIADAAAVPMAAESRPGPDAYTSTNNQIAGVEEPDFIKNDGTRLFQIAGNKLHILRTWPAELTAEAGVLAFEGERLSTMLFDGKDRLVVFANPIVQMQAYKSLDYRKTRVHIVDVANLAQPTVLKSYEVAGTFHGARRSGGKVRMIVSNGYDYPEGASVYPNSSDYWRLSSDERIAWYETQRAKNHEIVQAQTPEHWLGMLGLTQTNADGTVTSVADPAQCARVKAPTVSTSLGATRIASLDLDSGALVQTVLLAGTSTVFATEKSLYLATPYWWWDDDSRDRDFTFVHAFDTSGDEATYVGSGGVEGTPNGQFAFDEYLGNLRVATTVTRRTGDWSWDTVNHVSVLDGSTLGVLGVTPDMAPGERMYGVRFRGPLAYVVTFRQTDPLFVVDLAEPTAPKVVGELKIPGFSTYLQPLDDTHLLAIGRDAGVKLSLFDVSDPTAPREVATKKLGNATYSVAGSNHLAFTYFPARGLLAIPGTSYATTPDGFGKVSSGLWLFGVDAQAGFSDAGTLTMEDVKVQHTSSYGQWQTAAAVSRSVFADDYVYAVSDLGVRVARSADPGTPLATVRFPLDPVEDLVWYRSWCGTNF